MGFRTLHAQGRDAAPSTGVPPRPFVDVPLANPVTGQEGERRPPEKENFFQLAGERERFRRVGVLQISLEEKARGADRSTRLPHAELVSNEVRVG